MFKLLMESNVGGVAIAVLSSRANSLSAWFGSKLGKRPTVDANQIRCRVARLKFSRRCSALSGLTAAAEPIDEAGDGAHGRDL